MTSLETSGSLENSGHWGEVIIWEVVTTTGSTVLCLFSDIKIPLTNINIIQNVRYYEEWPPAYALTAVFFH